ncbi:uncharacterized protein LOC122661037 [Telopea speciosissima]|uniref:uncharacterized protein LOC122661037 n=1 Tax=Telopea speciosissima TaxID=54955 RepID=UPI001CC4184F|nr:uncharacterized protein LOC122661037 [Telopea speciosissima]XP_043712276.1 uncharacterized protein LOC122661037 [Telopea speciosissima]
MFEGLVRQLLLGYLGRYVKEIQKDQLKIGLWSEEVLLENVELILEAFDYLQLPFALKQGRVGRLSIKIPWKKLGWDPIVIVLEDVFIRACRRDDNEWALDSVVKREYAGKKAKLAAAELAKLSGRVCDNKAGQSFISYMTAKILDGIQLSINNVHVMYIDEQTDMEWFVFGLRLSSLMIMKQNIVGSSLGILRGGQVNKIVEISSLEIYCSTIPGSLSSIDIENIGDSKVLTDPVLGYEKCDYILAPLDVAVSLVVNRSGKIENGAPQYSITAELTALVIVLNEIQLQQILILWDYLDNCQLRKRYGRYRPWSNLLSQKYKGWQRMWWHYAQECVLLEIRRKLRKTSWRYLGWRISSRRKYVNLYKRKLDFLQRDQAVSDDILSELELLEKESDVDDILSYRSIAEQEMQESPLSLASSNMVPTGSNSTVEKQQNDETSSGRSRGWLNWLSLGVLGAGGAADSSQFSGVVSDGVIKDIYEATEFHPPPSLDGVSTIKDKTYFSSFKFNIHQSTATLKSKRDGRETVQLTFDGAIIECKLWNDSATIIASLNSMMLVNPCSNNVILLSKKVNGETNALEIAQPCVSVQVDTSPIDHDLEISLKVLLQPIEVTFDRDFFVNLLDFCYILRSFQFHHERVLLSLNGFEDTDIRLLSKAEYILLNHTKIIWDVNFSDVIIKFPWKNVDSGSLIMILEVGVVRFRSRMEMHSPASSVEGLHSYFSSDVLRSTSINNKSPNIRLQDLYECFEIFLTDFEVKITFPHSHQALSVFEKFTATVILESCIIHDELLLKQLQVHLVLPSLSVHFSPSIYGAVVECFAYLDIPESKSELKIHGRLDLSEFNMEEPRSSIFQYSVAANLNCVCFHVDLADDVENSLVLIFALGELDMQYYSQEQMDKCSVSVRTLKINTSVVKDGTTEHILCLSKNISAANSVHEHKMGFELGKSNDSCGDRSALAEGCFLLHYESSRSVGIICRRFTVFLNDVDIHCYPNIFRMLLEFYDRMSTHVAHSSASSEVDSSGFCEEFKCPQLESVFESQTFGFSNFCRTEATSMAGIPLDNFPFITIHQSGCFSNLESSLVYSIPQWRRNFQVGDRNSVRSPKFGIWKRSEMFKVPTIKPSIAGAFGTSASCKDADSVVVLLDFNGIRVHFHDSSCTLATLTLTASKSLLFFHGIHYWDVLCSVDKLLLSSSWSSQNFQEYLWGSSLPNLSSVLNIRLRKVNGGALGSQIEISIGIQHVCCVLMSEFLAIIIGYFSSPDWNPNGNKQCIAENHEYDAQISVSYKIEILDSLLILPLEDNEHQSVQLEPQQLYLSFVQGCSSVYAVNGIPCECMVPANNLSDKVDLLNVFGRDVSLSLLLIKDEEQSSSELHQDTQLVSLIAALDADLWVRIPCESETFCGDSSAPTCVMMKVGNCQVISQDDYLFYGVETIVTLISQLSSVNRESKGFTSDVFQFRQFKRSLREDHAIHPDASSVNFTIFRCCVNALYIKLYHSRGGQSVPSKLIAEAAMQFKLSASFKNETPLCLDVDFSSLTLYSFHTSAILVHCTSEGSVSSGINVHFSKSDEAGTELVVSISSLDIWLHLSDWREVIDLVVSHTQPLAKTSIVIGSTINSDIHSVKLTENTGSILLQNAPESPKSSTSFVSGNIMQDPVHLIVKAENIGISFHFPVWVKEEVLDKYGSAEAQKEILRKLSTEITEGTAAFQPKHAKYIAVTLHGRGSQLTICGTSTKFNFNVEKTSGRLEDVKDGRVFSWPFFKLYHVNVAGEIHDKKGLVHASSDLQIENLDVWLSYHTFNFWHGIGFETFEAGSSDFSFGTINFKVHLKKASILLSDGRWICNGPLLVILVRNLLLHAYITNDNMETSVSGDLRVNYNNIDKVMWEPFVEPWKFQLNIIRKNEQSALLNTSFITNFHLMSTTQLNLNLTEPLIEVICRVKEMMKDACNQVGLNDLPERQTFLECQTSDSEYTRRYAPYILQNETSLPLSFQLYSGSVNGDDSDILAVKDGNFVPPDSSVPIYIDKTPEEQIFCFRPGNSSDRLSEKKSNGVLHHKISIQLDGTSRPSPPISMDIVGLSYFEVDFSQASDKRVDKNEVALKYNRKIVEKSRTDAGDRFVVPVVFDVSVQRYSKLVRLYSTVILYNSTTMPLELRFDIPFGVSPKVLDPIYPGKEFPLTLHLAEAGRIRWRPIGSSYLWSEAHQLSNILSHENRLGFMRSFVCYPSHPSSDPFRCCVSVEDIILPSSNVPKKGSPLCVREIVKQSAKNDAEGVRKLEKSKKRFIHRVALITPFLVKNYLPRAVSLTIESGGVTRTVSVPEVETASIFHIDSTHDLGIVFHVHGFKQTVSKFPRAEKFTEVSKFSEAKFSSYETLTFYPELSNGPVHLTLEKVMDPFCGARELCISVPFLLYNCTALSLIIADSGNEMKGNCDSIPSCYHLIGQEKLMARKQGLGLIFSKHGANATDQNIDDLRNSLPTNVFISLRENHNLFTYRSLGNDFISSDSSTYSLEHVHSSDTCAQKATESSSKHIKSEMSVFEEGEKSSYHYDNNSRKVKACMYSPHPISSASELMVRLSTSFSETMSENFQSSWSSPFFLVPPSGSTSVLIPQPSTAGVFIISVTSSPVTGPFSTRTRAITFQPRYVISNACSKELSFKQKGTDVLFNLGVGQHSHLHWTDTTRELLVSIRFHEPGWLWSGSFYPDHIGDTQMKMRNYVSGASNMIRVEVQNADVSIKDDKIVGSSQGKSGTYLILLSDDDTSFMPYRIDNFSKEKLRIYQQKCETFDTTVHSYTSFPYAWDEPCFPHRLVIEVPGERVLGSFDLDQVKDYVPVCLPSTPEKPERKLFVSIHAEGAIKVLSIIDSSYHLLKDMKKTHSPSFKGKNKAGQEEKIVDYTERISVHLSFIGVSLMNSQPQELLFICAKDTKIDVLQSVDQQKFSFQIYSLQIDNQLHNTPYPVILSFDHAHRGNSANQVKNMDYSSKVKNGNVIHVASDNSCTPMLCLSAAKWRTKEISLVSFEYISLRLAALRLELEEEVVLSLFEFVRTVISRLQNRALPHQDSSLNSLVYTTDDGNPALPSVVPIGAPWQQIYLLARRQKKIYVEIFDVDPIKLTLSFSSTPWLHRNYDLTPAESLVHIGGTAVQRSLMALADVEEAPVYLRQLTIMHHMASWESILDILIRHYTWQFLHEMYKVFGSAGVFGNPMGFARNVGLGIKDFLSVPARGILQSPSGLITGMAQGTTSLLSNTIYAVSNAATQFSKAAHKGVAAFTFDDHAVTQMEKQQKGVLNEFLEGLTGFLQSPIKGAEKHGLPGVLSGIALGTAGLVARPVASILEVTGKTAQSIRNRSNPHQSHHFRVRFPRPLARELPLRPYSWEEAIGTWMLLEADERKFKDEIFVMCKMLKQSGKFVIMTLRVILVVCCSSLEGLGTTEFQGVADPEWVIEVEMGLESVIHVDREEEVVNIVGSRSDNFLKQHESKRGGSRTKQCSTPASVPLFQMSIELVTKEEAEDVLQVLLATIEHGKDQGWGLHVLHQGNIR